jgi:hypothetical protein
MGSWLGSAYSGLAGVGDHLAGSTDEAVGRFTHTGNVSELTPNVQLADMGKLYEGYTRALGGGLVEPQTGSASVLDPGGEFEGKEWSGNAFAPDVILEGGGKVGEKSVDLAAKAAETSYDITTDITGGIWDNLPNELRYGLYAAIAIAVLYLIRPFAGLADTATN